MRYPIRKLGAVGIASLEDAEPHDLPPNAWTDGDSVVARDRAIRKALGYRNSIIDFDADALWFQAWETEDVLAIAFGMADSIRTTVDGQYVIPAALVDQAGAPLAAMATSVSTWQSEVFGAFCVMNNGADMPMYSSSFAAGPPATWTFRQIPGWGVGGAPTGAVAVVRAAYNHLVGLGVEDFPYTVFTSARGSPETFPTDWDNTVPGSTAKAFPVQSADGPLVDGGMLNGRFIVYQRYACSAMDYVGGAYIFALRRLFECGLCNRDAFAAFDSFHLVVGEREIVLHNGSAIVGRPAEDRVQKRFYAECTDLASVHCTTDNDNTEVLIHYNGDRVLVFNYGEQTWSFETVGNDVERIDRAVGPSETATWSSMSMPWSEATPSWASYGIQQRITRLFQLQARSLDERNVGYTRQDDNAGFGLVGVAGPGDRLLANGADGSGDRFVFLSGTIREFDAWQLREYIDLDELTGDAARVKRVMALYPQARGSGVVNMQVGISNTPRDPPRWGAIRRLDLSPESRQERVDVRLAGRYLHWRIGSWDGAELPGGWSLSGMDADIYLEGAR